MTGSDAGASLRPALTRRHYGLLVGVIALATGLAVFVVATELFPYHSANHDEGVYLQQAAMLLEGTLHLAPGSEPLREAFHPWFFVESEAGLSAKYTPVPAALFALGKLAGGYRLTLVVVAVANVALVAAIATEAFDRRTGVIAAVLLAAAPLFVLTSSVFLPYAPTTALNLLFALSYVRSVRRRSRPYAAVAGLAAGLAFFARPYTAVLFATPFVVHALYRLGRAVPDDHETVGRTAITAAVGLALVGVTLAYNATLTGSPLLFPYEAFAPLDGLGFGRRRILGYERVYTPALALRANALVLWALATEWFTAGPLGTVAAILGTGAVVAGVRSDGLAVEDPLSDRLLQVLVLGVLVTVALGNVYFWGNLNVLGGLSDPDDGLVSLFGPFYHFDALLPLSVLAAHGTLVVAERLGTRLRAWARATEGVGVARALGVGALLALLVTFPVLGAAEASVLGPPVERNAGHTGKLETAYEPFRTTDLEGALVFLPPTYGEWRNHPFQWLRNDPGFDGPTVYATARDPEDDFAVLDAYPDRRHHRFRHHGEWTPDPDERVVPVLERTALRGGSSLAARTEVSVPDRVTGASVAVSNGNTTRRYDHRGTLPETLAVNWSLAPDGAAVDHPNLTARTPSDRGTVPITGADRVVLAVTIREPGGGTLTYREAVLVRRSAAGVEALWPPASSMCTLVTECEDEDAYVPGRPDTRPTGTRMNTTLVTVGE